MEEQHLSNRSAGDEDEEPQEDGSVVNIQLTKPTRRATSLQTHNTENDVDHDLEITRTPIQTIIEALEDEISSDSEKSLPNRPSYLEQGPLTESADIFEKLGSIPSINQIEAEPDKHSTTKSIRSSKSPRHGADDDVGLFADPLTGEALVSEEEERESEEEAPALETVEEETESSSTQRTEVSEDDELLALIKPDIELEVRKEVAEDAEVFETFLEIKKVHVIEEKIEFDWAAYEREQKEKKIAANEFFNEVIKTVVEKCEYIDPKILLRQNLDKTALTAEIMQKLEELEMEQKARVFLNRRVCEYYRRKGRTRVFVDDPPETIIEDMHKYRATLANLDQMLEREMTIKTRTQQQISQLEQEQAMLKLQNDEKLLELEQIVRKTIAQRGERLPLVVNSLLQKMGKLRDEISAIRNLLVQKQHNNATLEEQLRNLEDLGNNLRMRDFERLQTEVEALDKKVEDRNANLSKSEIRCNTNIHIMSHIKEKQARLHNKVKIQKATLLHLQQQKQIAREQVFKAKSQRIKLRKEIQELSFQCGLLDKPALMLDYDVTVQQVQEAGERVVALRHKHDDLLRKIAKLENKCI